MTFFEAILDPIDKPIRLVPYRIPDDKSGIPNQVDGLNFV